MEHRLVQLGGSPQVHRNPFILSAFALPGAAEIGFIGPDSVRGELSRLLHVEGRRLIGGAVQRQVAVGTAGAACQNQRGRKNG